jgi:undecaprenyl diphosphate synthase
MSATVGPLRLPRSGIPGPVRRILETSMPFPDPGPVCAEGAGSQPAIAVQAAARPRLPRHIAIIMDGNGRWANVRGWERTRGHLEGAESVRAVTRECARLGIEALTLYAFSSENWRRPPIEVRFLMGLLERYLLAERREILENDIRLRAIGEVEALPPRVQKVLAETMSLSAANRGMVLTLALNYGGRAEIVRAARRLALEVQAGTLRPEDIDARALSARLDTAGLPDPDIVIRTGGEMRLSGFLLWQVEYSELWITETAWPDFREEDLHAALKDFAARERRFGGV